MSLVAGFCLLLAGAALPAAAYPRPGVIERVSVASDGSESEGYAAFPSISDDGRFVAFDSDAGDLVPGDTNRMNDIFVHDRLTGRTELVSMAEDGREANGPVYLARISSSGRFVMFQSGANNLVPGDSGMASDVFVRDLEAGTLERVTLTSDGQEANSLSFPGQITPDGRYVAFESFASNLAPGDGNQKSDVFVRDRVTGTTERVSLRADGKERIGDSYSPSISDDGRFVAYVALVGTQGEDNPEFIDEMQIFWHDRESGEVRLVSVSSDGRRGNGLSNQPQISGDGRTVAFVSQSQNLVPGDANRVADVFVHDTVTGSTRRVSVTTEGEEANGASGSLSMSGDGQHVAFTTTATNLAPGDTNGRKDAFVHDLATGVTERVSLGAGGEEPASHSENTFVAGGGRFVAFANYSPLVAGDTNNARDIFVRDRGPVLGVGDATATRRGAEVDVSGWATFSGAAVSASADPPDDAGPEGESLGAELTGAEITYRPEVEDLLVRVAVSALPSVRPPQATDLAIACGLLGACGAGVAAAPAVTYGLDLEVNGTRYEVRAERGASPVAPVLRLLACEDVCTPVADLAGSIGVTEDEVVAAVPLADLGARPGDTLSGLRAWVGPGHPVAGAPEALDEVPMPSAALPTPTVSLAPLAEGEEEPVDGAEVAAELAAGSFSAVLTAGPGHDRLVARACLGEECAAAVAPIPSG
jgi:Tol biopolymer transport system component